MCIRDRANVMGPELVEVPDHLEVQIVKRQAVEDFGGSHAVVNPLERSAAKPGTASHSVSDRFV